MRARPVGLDGTKPARTGRSQPGWDGEEANQPMTYAEAIFTGGTVRSPHDGWRPHEALAVAGGRVLALGTRAEVEALRGPGTRVVDLGGGIALPGLADAHLHLVRYGLFRSRLDLAGVRSLGELRERLAAAAARTPAGEWILGQGWLEDGWPEGRLPTAADLDAAAPDHPVLLWRGCLHVAVANSLALKLAGVGPGTPDPAGGALDRDESGRPTGILREQAIALVRRAVPEPTRAQMESALRGAAAELLRLGITQVQTDDMREVGSAAGTVELYRAALGPDGIPLRATLIIAYEHLPEARELGMGPGWGDGWLRSGHVKLFADGTLGGRTAALTAPYADDPGNRGMLIHAPEELHARVREVHGLGLQLGIHAIGDRALDLVLDAVAAAQAGEPASGSRRHRAIHCQITRPDQFRRLRDLGMVADIQPVFLHTDGHFFIDRVGPERAATAYAWGTLLRLGVPACAGSDAPVEPPNPFLGIHAAVTRQDRQGHPPEGWFPGERLTVAQALELYTRGAAFATFEEEFRGDLRPGKAADLTVVDRDPFTVPPEELLHLRVVMTVVDGRVAYRA